LTNLYLEVMFGARTFVSELYDFSVMKYGKHNSNSHWHGTREQT